MATGQPGFADSMFKLASQRQTALKAEQARVTNREITRRKDIDDLSGFNASLIEGDQQRSIFESAVADVQSYIAGTGEYENAEYDPLNFKTQINKITSLYNGFIGHNQGDAAAARTSLQNDAYTEGGQEIGRENGMVLMSNNTPTSYEGAVESHNNYFETAMVDGKPQFDENGHPIGYPVINGVVDRSKPPSSIFKMDAYANAENFKGESVEEQVPSLYDMSVTAQAEIQNKQNIVGPNGLQTLQEVSDLHFDNAVNDFDFLEGAIRDRNRANENSIEITDEEMRAYAAGELDSEKTTILDSYKAEAKEEWAKLTAYGRTGSGSESPFTGNTFEYDSSFTTEADANSAGGPNVDIDGNAMELVDPAYNVANMGYGINDINITSPNHGDYTVTGIIQTAQGAELGGGRFVMIPTEEEMIKLPDGSMVPMANASAEQQNFAAAGQPGYSIVDVPNNEMVPIDGPNADPRSREILRNLRNAGIGDADFGRNQAENMGRYEELVLEREAAEETARELQDEIDSTDVEFEENTEVGTGEELNETVVTDEQASAAAVVDAENNAARLRDDANAAELAAEVATNDDSVSDEDTQIATQRAFMAVNAADAAEAQSDEIAAVARETAAMAEADAAAENLEVATTEAKQAAARAELVNTRIRRASRPQGVGGLLKNLMEIGPRATYAAYRAQNDLKKQQEAEAKEKERLLAEEARLKAEEAAKEAAEVAERERLLGVERELIAEGESLERIPEVRAEAVSDAMGNINEVMGKHREETGSENLWTSPYGEIGNVAQILDPSSTNYKEELQAAIETYGYPPEGSPHKASADVMLDQSEFGPSQFPEITERLELRAPGEPWDAAKSEEFNSVIKVDGGYNAPKEEKTSFFNAAVEYLKSIEHPFPEAAAAQAALESNWGDSGLSRDNNNFFGIKPGSVGGTQKALRDAGVEFDIQGYATEEVIDAKTLKKFKKKYGDDMEIIKDEGGGKTRVKIPGEPFLIFATPEEGFKGYMAWVEYNMGDSLNAGSGQEYLQALKDGGYATSQEYVNHIIARAKSAGRSVEP